LPSPAKDAFYFAVFGLIVRAGHYVVNAVEAHKLRCKNRRRADTPDEHKKLDVTAPCVLAVAPLLADQSDYSAQLAARAFFPARLM
jgi:hypothetical protein